MNLLHQWLQTAVSLGLDSLVAGLAVGWILSGWRGRISFALGCGLCDGIASWAGAAVPHQLPDCFDAGLYLVCVGLLLAGAVRTRAWLYAMPVVLSIDNLAAGVSADQAPLLALSSAVMAASGLALAGLGRISVHLAAAPPEGCVMLVPQATAGRRIVPRRILTTEVSGQLCRSLQTSAPTRSKALLAAPDKASKTQEVRPCHPRPC